MAWYKLEKHVKCPHCGENATDKVRELECLEGKNNDGYIRVFICNSCGKILQIQ